MEQCLFKVKTLTSTIQPSVFGSKFTRGGADLPPPSKNGVNGWEVPKLSWNLIYFTEIDARQKDLWLSDT